MSKTPAKYLNVYQDEHSKGYGRWKTVGVFGTKIAAEQD